MGSKVILTVLPEAGEEIIESSHAGGIARFKSTDDCIGGISGGGMIPPDLSCFSLTLFIQIGFIVLHNLS